MNRWIRSQAFAALDLLLPALANRFHQLGEPLLRVVPLRRRLRAGKTGHPQAAIRLLGVIGIVHMRNDGMQERIIALQSQHVMTGHAVLQAAEQLGGHVGRGLPVAGMEMLLQRRYPFVELGRARRRGLDQLRLVQIGHAEIENGHLLSVVSQALQRRRQQLELLADVGPLDRASANAEGCGYAEHAAAVVLRHSTICPSCR